MATTTGLLADFTAKVKKAYAKKNDLIVYDPNEVIETIGTGCLPIDMEFNGGLAIVGRLIEISSLESGGKSTLMMQTCVQAKKKGIVLFFDNEQAFDYTYARSLGLVEDENFVVFRPMNAEETEDITVKAMEAMGSAISMIVYDSVAGCRTKSELEQMQGESSQKSQHATFWGSFGVKLVGYAAKHKIAVCLINQIRAKPMLGQNDKYSITNSGLGAGYSNTDNQITTTGGNALKYWFSARYLARNSTSLKEQVEDEVTGEVEELRVANVFRIESIKNKCFAPYKRAKYVIRFGHGTDDSSIIKDYLTAVGVISTSGSFISYKGTSEELSFRVNGKIAFNRKFMEPAVQEDAKKQYLELKSTGVPSQQQSPEDIWGEGVSEETEALKVNYILADEGGEGKVSEFEV